MADNKHSLTETAKNLAFIFVIAYAVVKQALLFISPRIAVESMSVRALVSIIMVAMIMVIRRKAPNRWLAVLIPVAIAFPEMIWVAFIQHGEWLFYFFLTGCTLLGMLFLNPRGLAAAIVINSAALAFLSFVLRIRVSGPELTPWDDIFGFAGVTFLNMLIYFICRQAANTFEQYRYTGEAFDKLLEVSPSFVSVINERARIDHITQAMASWLGISRRQYAKGRAFLDLFRKSGIMPVIQRVMDYDGTVEEMVEMGVGDEKRHYILRSSKMGQIGVARTVEFTDITAMVEARRMAEESDRQKSSFLANMSHEIRTPMNAIVGMTELMLTTPLNAEQTSHALAVKGAAMSLLTIVNDILDFSKISAEKMEIIAVPFDIASLINDTLSITNIKAQEAGLALTALISKDIPPQINGDEVRIRQCLLNLLGNAVKYTKTGGIALAVSSEHLDGGLKLSFRVKDTGRGMKEEEIGKLFGIFTRIDTKRNRNITGTGLGLAITKNLVEMMGGQIKVESVYGEGSVFSFYIICEGQHEGRLAPFPEPDKYNVLAYEPNKYNARALRSMLLDLGVRHQVCRSPNDFKHQLQGGYTHVFYDKSAMDLVQNYTGGSADFIVIKDMRDTNLNMKAMNRPILTTTLVRCLTGADGDKTDGHGGDAVRLGAFKTRNVRALLVDDNPVNLTVAEGMLRRYDIKVATALNGREGLYKIQRDDYDIAFLDHMMPVMDGVEAAVAIRALGGRFKDLPLIALTANAMSDAQKMFKEAGMDGFIAKPIIVKELHNTLLKFLPEEKVRK